MGYGIWDLIGDWRGLDVMRYVLCIGFGIERGWVSASILDGVTVRAMKDGDGISLLDGGCWCWCCLVPKGNRVIDP
jgi:hypothetical protein